MFQIRQATEKDTHYIYEINKDAFGYDYPEEKTKERLKYITNRQTDKIWVACEGDLVVGYIHGADYECTYSDSLKNIMALAVDEKYRGRGIGKQLLMTIKQGQRTIIVLWFVLYLTITEKKPINSIAIVDIEIEKPKRILLNSLINENGAYKY